MSAIEKIREIIATTDTNDLPKLYDDLLGDILGEIGNQPEQLAAQLRAGLGEVDFDELIAWIETGDKS